LYNLTWHEIYNSVECTYLFEEKIDNGRADLKYKNPFDKGFKKNVKSFFKSGFLGESDLNLEV